MQDAFDWIVVGAGSAGAVVAGRLAASGAGEVLLLEAGTANRHPLVRIPKGIARLVQSPRHCWFYQVESERPEGFPPEVWVRGRGLGGSSAVNGMIWSRGQPEDYAGWASLAGAHWDYPNMLATFRALEDHPYGPSERFGAGGPVPITPGGHPDQWHPLSEAMVAAGEEMGLTRVSELNGHAGPRVGYYSHNIRHGKRVSAADAFLAPVRGRPNLEVRTGALVDRVWFEKDRAAGVEVLLGGRRHRFHCRREVVLCAGTLESPCILQRSGVGPADLLAHLGVPVVADIPAVGRGMREHLSVAVSYRIRPPGGNHRAFQGLGLAWSATRYLLAGRGPLATGPFEVGGFASLEDTHPDFQLYLGGYVFRLSDDAHPVPLGNLDPEPGITLYGQLLRLASEGEVAIASPDPRVPPRIRPNWLAAEEDRRLAVAALRYLRQYAHAPPLARHLVAELSPGGDLQSDAELLSAFRRLATSGLHGTGTCRMGRDGEAVVDEQLRVRGVAGLRVADCSVMPAPISGNTNAPAMAVGWRAADFLLAAR
ncbi:MAG: GMC oxidoreductase [Porticoccaceae bacterium]|nr:MAG: GMC oxidoreductase [Porticoccaceae bacterium]